MYRIIALDYADAMVEEGRDRYGPEDTPLFAITLDRETLTLSTELTPIGNSRAKDRSVGAADPMDHQQLYQLLYALSEQSGDARYRRAADEALAHFFRHTQQPTTGFMPWGEHLAWGLREEAALQSGQDEPLHEMKQWDLWPKVYELAPDAARRFAQALSRYQVRPDGRFSRHAPYRRRAPEKGNEFPRYAGNMIVAWTHAYARADDDEALRREMIRSLEKIASVYQRERHAVSGALPWAWSSRQWGSYRSRVYRPKSVLQMVQQTGRALRQNVLPDSTQALLRAMVADSDEVLLRAFRARTASGRPGFLMDADLETLEPNEETKGRRAFSFTWEALAGAIQLTSTYAHWMLDRYEQAGDERYRRLALSAAQEYLQSAPPPVRMKEMQPSAYAEAIQLMLRAHRLTGEERYLQRANFFGVEALSTFLSARSPLPRASSNARDYDASSGGDDLMLAFSELGQVLETADVQLEHTPELPSCTFTLRENYPNPFHQSTRIKYRLSCEARVVIEVYDVLGRRVATLDEGSKGRGSHQATFQASTLASGTYLYRLRIGGQAMTRTMVVVR